MVAIKIRSLEDIVKAYLENFEFNAKKVEQGVQYLITNCQIDHDNVTASLDALLLKKAKKIYPEKVLSNEQKTAMLKLAFVLANGAQEWKVQDLFGSDDNQKLFEKMRANAVVPAPEYVLSNMFPQAIEMPDNLWKKLWGKKRK